MRICTRAREGNNAIAEQNVPTHGVLNEKKISTRIPHEAAKFGVLPPKNAGS